MTRTTTYTVIPAAAGWEYVLYIEDGEVMHEPIVAWEIEITRGSRNDGSEWVYRVTWPIMVSGNYECTRNQTAIKRPDGLYEIPMSETFTTLGDLISHWRRLEIQSKEVA